MGGPRQTQRGTQHRLMEGTKEPHDLWRPSSQAGNTSRVSAHARQAGMPELLTWGRLKRAESKAPSASPSPPAPPTCVMYVPSNLVTTCRGQQGGWGTPKAAFGFKLCAPDPAARARRSSGWARCSRAKGPLTMR